MAEPLRSETVDRVRVLTLARADEYNTINPALRDALSGALDDAEQDRDVSAVLLRAEGPAFCAGYQLDWATAGQAEARRRARAPGIRPPTCMIGRYAPTVEAAHAVETDDRRRPGLVHRGGTNMVLHADLIVCSTSALSATRRCGCGGSPKAVGMGRASVSSAACATLHGRRSSGPEAERLGLVLECVADDDLDARGSRTRIARLPLEQLQMIMGIARHRTPCSARCVPPARHSLRRRRAHTQEGLDSWLRSVDVGFRQAVRERDDPSATTGAAQAVEPQPARRSVGGGIARHEVLRDLVAALAKHRVRQDRREGVGVPRSVNVSDTVGDAAVEHDHDRRRRTGVERSGDEAGQ
jgi:enoyl-CoA hydratase